MNETPLHKGQSEDDELESELEFHKTKPKKRTLPFLKRVRDNLKARRHLLIVIAFVLLLFKVFANVSLTLIFTGYAIILLSSGLLPRLGVLRPLVSVRRMQPLESTQPVAYQSIIDAMPGPAIMLNVYGILLFINDEAADFFPGARENQHLSSFIRDPDFLDAVVQAGKQTEATEVTYSVRVPVERHMNVTVAPLNHVEKKASNPAILVSLKDLTEQERASQMRSDFIANASHELRTPLASVMGFIDTIQGSAKNDENAREHFLNIMREQIERMTRLIDDMLSLSRVELVAHVKPSDQVDLNEVTEYVLATLHPIAESRKTTLKHTTDLEAADVLGARDELIQLFQNLVQNAIKYGKDNGTVHIHIQRLNSQINGNDMISVSVSDDGPGIDEKYLPRLTERFYRVDNEVSRQKGGTGLGLAIVKHIVNRHRGELKIESKLDVGTHFTILIPEYETV